MGDFASPFFKKSISIFQGQLCELSMKTTYLFSFKTPTPEGRAVMSGEGVAYCASSMRNGVKK